jgi:xylan 1,4-beta-xylosidase
MLSKMSGERVAVESTGAVPLDDMLQRGVRENPDVGAFASLDPTTETVAVMVWHYHDDDLSGPAAAVELLITGLPFSEGTAEVTHYRIDEDHSNAYAMWQRMGSPIAPSQREYDRLQEASDLAKLSNVPEIVTIQDKQATVRFELPRRGVSLLLLQ